MVVQSIILASCCWRLFIALLRRYGIAPYRRYRQRHTTVMAIELANMIVDV